LKYFKLLKKHLSNLYLQNRPQHCWG